MKIKNHKSLGFSLIEMSIVLAVLGLITGGMLSISASRKENTNVIGLDKQFDAIDEAIEGYISRYGYLPCPASYTAVENTTSFGRTTDCSAAAPSGTFETLTGTDTLRIGALPVRSLMLPDKYGYDKWGTRLTYVVIKELAKSTATLDGYTTSRTDGIIKVTDYAGNQVTEANTKAINAYIIISHSKDKRGGYSGNGQVMKTCSSTKDTENCDNDNTFIDSEVNESETSADFYYDFVRWKSLPSLIGAAEVEDDSILKFSSNDKIACIVRATGEGFCIGDNSNGQIGDGTTTDRAVYTPLAGGVTGWKRIEVDNNFACGIANSDAMYCWGENTLGTVGDNTTVQRTIPTAVVPATGSNTGWTLLDIDDGHACGIRSGHMLCWGDDSGGQIGDNAAKGGFVDQPTEVQGNYNDWVDVVVGSNHSCGVRNESGLYKAYCWGDNSSGQLGDNSTTERLTPTEVYGGFTNWSDLIASGDFTCGIRTNGTLWCWGKNTGGAVGDNTLVNKDVPTQVKDTAGTGYWYDWSSASASSSAACGIRAGGALYCWGQDNFGQLGNGATTGNKTTPQLVSGGFTNWNAVFAGKTTCGMVDDTLYCWGQNIFGEVGDGTLTNPVTAPVAVTAYP